MKLERHQLQHALQSGTKVFAFQFGRGSGFCAEYIWLLTCLVKCLQFGYDFRLGKISHPKGFAVKEGWDDYFEPFFRYVDGPYLERLNLHQFPLARRMPFTKAIARAWLKSTSRPAADLFMFDDLGELRFLGPPVFTDHQEFVSACKDLLDALWVYNKQTSEEVEERIAKIDLPPDYVAIHVRRGDKHTEHPYIPIANYAAAIRSLELSHRNVFVATDDHRTVAEVRTALPGYEIYYPKDPKGPKDPKDQTSAGYDQRSFNSLSARERRAKTVDFLAEFELMKRAPWFIGSDSTNVAALVGFHRDRDRDRTTWV